MRYLRACFAVLVLAAVGAAPPAAQVTVKLIAINDLHGYLEPSETYGVPDPADPKKTLRVPVGGVAYIATAIQRLRAQNPRNFVVGAGDLIGASPLSSALFHDEPSIEALNALGLSVSAVGNHEFDEGKNELLRKQHGGCRNGGTVGVDTCLFDGKFAGAAFPYLSANVIDESTGKTLFPPYVIRTIDAGHGKRIGIAFIGVVLKDTPLDTTELGSRGLRFTDEATAVNALLPQFAAKGVHAVVILIHQGLFTNVPYNDQSCGGASGDLIPVLNHLDRSIRVVLSAHTHWAYICPHGQGTTNPNVFYSQAGRYGQFLTNVDVTLDVASDTIVDVHGRNELIVNDRAPNPSSLPALPADPAIAALVQKYVTATAPLVNRVVGHITADIVKDGNRTNQGEWGEAPMADVVADARLAATQAPPMRADFAIINGGGVRAPLPFTYPGQSTAPGDVTFGAAHNVLPFNDVLLTETLTGAQVLELLNENWNSSKEMFGVSHNVAFTWDASLPGTAKVVPGSVKINGKPLDPAARYRITIDGFLASGGDNYTVLKQGTDPVTGPIDIQSLTDYLATHNPLAPPPRDRVTRLH